MELNPLKPKPRPRKPLGKPIAWSDATLSEMSQITAADKAAADALWRNEAPAWAKALLEATPEEHKPLI